MKDIMDIKNYLEEFAKELKVGDKIRKNHGAFKASNQIFEVTKITENTIYAKCCEVIRPSISQQKMLKKLLNEELAIDIKSGGSFPGYIKF